MDNEKFHKQKKIKNSWSRSPRFTAGVGLHDELVVLLLRRAAPPAASCAAPTSRVAAPPHHAPATCCPASRKLCHPVSHSAPRCSPKRMLAAPPCQPRAVPPRHPTSHAPPCRPPDATLLAARPDARSPRWDGLCACLKRLSTASTSASESGGERVNNDASRFASAPVAMTSAIAAQMRPTCSGWLDAAASACFGEPPSSSSETVEVERHLPNGNRKCTAAAPHAGGVGRGEPKRERDLADSRGSAPLGSGPTPAPWRSLAPEPAVRCDAG
uniref:Uncharacterized protein n=1 Tax=Arundo donax TaxID=35708 RepID=A0A0A9CPI1_ARUDO